MTVHVTSIMLGVKDLQRAKSFYSDGLGGKVGKDFPNFVEIDLGEGSSSIALYEWDAAAQDAGVSSEGTGFRGVSFHFIASSNDEVDDVIATAVSAGATVVKKPEGAQWGYSGYFADPDGYLWKIASS